MKNSRDSFPDYGNWVSKKMVITIGIISFCLLILTMIALFHFKLVFTIVIVLLFMLFLVSFIYFFYAHIAFSDRGGNIQNKIYDLVFKYIEFNGFGKILDIGCGNGKLTIRLAKKFPNSYLYGIDYWGGMWGYSEKSCTDNAMCEGVDSQIIFKKASASSLPFDENTFDMAISNFVFHEVIDTKKKIVLIKEALRILKPGGSFVFQDLFLSSFYYGNIDNLIDEIKSWGIDELRFVNTSESKFIPKALRLPFMIGKIGIIYGKK
jgi:SAM-dependent methyltransferase